MSMATPLLVAGYEHLITKNQGIQKIVINTKTQTPENIWPLRDQSKPTQIVTAHVSLADRQLPATCGTI
jgi:hypothetical protein